MVTRRKHPLEGQTLDVFCHIHKKGKLFFVAIHPDGSKSHIPAAWTDFNGTSHNAPGPETIGLPPDLIAMRTIIDRLLRLLPCLDHQLSGQQDEEKIKRHATKAETTEHRVGALGSIRPKGSTGALKRVDENTRQHAESGKRVRARGSSKRKRGEDR